MPINDSFDQNNSASEGWAERAAQIQAEDGDDPSKGLTIDQIERSADMTGGGKIKPYGHALSSGDAFWAMCEFLRFPMPSECTFSPEATMQDAFKEGYVHALRVAGICLQKMVQIGIAAKPKDRPWPENGLYRSAMMFRRLSEHAKSGKHPIKRETKEEGTQDAQGANA